QTTTIGEVLGLHVGDRELLTGTERPVQLLHRLVVQTIRVLHGTGGVAEARTAGAEEVHDAGGREVTVGGDYATTLVSRIADHGVAEPNADAECEGHVRLIGRQSRTVLEVRHCVGVRATRTVGEQLLTVSDLRSTV